MSISQGLSSKYRVMSVPAAEDIIGALLSRSLTKFAFCLVILSRGNYPDMADDRASPRRCLFWTTVLLCSMGRIVCENVWLPSGGQHGRVNFVLVGATGNLAQKYLWQGLYDLYEASGDEVKLAVHGGARADASLGADALKGILETNVRYASNQRKESFTKDVRYVQLKTCQDYEAFCRDVLNAEVSEGYCTKEACEETEAPEVGRVFYLAVPPYSYGELAECVHRVCRPVTGGSSKPWLRVVLEKPYGSDLEGVTALTTSLLQNFEEDEVYLIDHYLGKAAIKQILPFRYDNRHWLEPLLSNEYVERIEVVIKEQEDAEGRLNYYDSYGVFLDILQNHGMEMLTLVAMDLPVLPLNDSMAIREQKVKFLRSVAPIHPRHLLVGQYDDYVQHGKTEFKNEHFESNTATFGAALLRVPTSRWKGVPVVLMSGKALDAKASYIRILFKDAAFALRSSARIPKDKELIINVGSQYSDIKGPSIAISTGLLNSLPPAAVQSDWSKELSESIGHTVYRYLDDDRAYSVVVSDIVFGKRESFVGIKQLTASWNMWTLAVDYLKTSPKPMLYGKRDIASLEFRWAPHGLAFSKLFDPTKWPMEEMPRTVDEPDRLVVSLQEDASVTNTVFVKPTMDLMGQMAQDLLDIAVESVKERGFFHVAFPGGRSPKPLFHILTAEWRFPWGRTHVWFADERCTPTANPQHSNFWNAEEQLLKHVNVPRSQVHPMPVELARGLCHADDQGAQLYEQWMVASLEGGALDVVVLGVGADGHVASLFPGAMDSAWTVGKDTSWVELTTAPPGMPIEKRMSLTYQAISQARNVFVVVTGKDKHGVAKQLLEGDVTSGRQLPVCAIQQLKNVRLYIDDLAYNPQSP